MSVHLVNPSDTAFGTAVITPRWLFVLAAATPAKYGDPIICDETLEQLDPNCIQAGDVVGIGIHTGNALRGYEIGRIARERGAWVVYGGIHSTLYAEETFERGYAHVAVKGDGDLVWADVIRDCHDGNPNRIYDGGRVDADQFKAARWDLLPPDKYMWASVQTVRGCAKHCSFCSVWRTDGQKPRQRGTEIVIEEIVQLRRKGFRFIALADDNFYPVTLTDLKLAKRQGDEAKLQKLQATRDERFELMEALAELPPDMIFLHTDHDGSCGRCRVSTGHEEGAHQGSLGGSGSCDAGRLEGCVQGLQFIGRQAGGAVEDLRRQWRPYPGVIHFWPAKRSGRDLCCHP